MRPRAASAVRLTTMAGVAVLYLAAAKVGLLFAAISPSATAVWPPAGIAFAACLVLGYRVWPAIFLGAFLANVTTAGSVGTSFAIAAGNTLESLAGAALVTRWANGPKVFDRARDIFAFVGLAALASTTISATIGVTSLALGGYVQWSDYGPVWLTWWLGDATGELIFSPLLVLWARTRSLPWSRDQVVEAALLLCSLLVVGGGVFGRASPLGHFPLSFLCIPPLLWAAFRFGPRDTATATVLMSAIAVWGTFRILGSLSTDLRNNALLLLQVFMATISVTALSVAALAWDRKRADEAHSRLAAIVESSDDAIVSKTVDGVITSWNRAAERIFGWAAVEAVGRPIKLIIPEDRHTEEDAVLARIRRGEIVDHFETVRITKDGRLRNISLTVSPIRDGAGRVVGASKIARDITERKRVEAERTALLAAERQAQEQLHTVVDTMSAPVTRCSRDLRYLWVSKPYADWLGRSVEDIIGRSIADVIGAEAFAAIAPHVERVLAGERVEYEAQVPFRAPGLRWIHAVYTPTFGTGDQPDGWVAVVLDVDERRRMEDALRTAIASAEHARQDAEAAARARDEFLAMLGHELRNPLGAIASAVAVLRLGTPDTTERARQVIGRQTLHLSRLVEDLLDVSRVMSGKVALDRRPIDLGELVNTVLRTWRATARLDRHTVSVETASVWIFADELRIEQVISNLLENALKYTPAEGHVTVRVFADGDTAVLEVADGGIGIAPELIGRIFDLFVQGHQTLDRAQGGLGLGLTLVKALVRAHGGEVQARSDGPGRGAAFTMRLPRVLAPSPETPQAAPMPSVSAPRRILIIEDNDDARGMLRVVLAREGHDVYEAADGSTGIDMAASVLPDVALIDIGLPHVDGYETARRIRAGRGGTSILLIAVTGYGQPEDRQRALAAGFDTHLTKPVSVEQVAAAMDQRMPR